MPSAKAIDKLRAEIVRRHDRFSPRLKQVARFVLENPNDMGFESLSDIAVRCDVRPSTIVRFAKALGFKGGSALQRLFRDELLASSSSHAYSARIKGLSWLERAGVLAEGPHRLMQEFARENINALTLMKNSIRNDQVRRAVSLICDARTVYLAGVRRSFPVAAYLSYALRQAGKPQVHLLDGRAQVCQGVAQGPPLAEGFGRVAADLPVHPRVDLVFDPVEIGGTHQDPRRGTHETRLHSERE